MAVSPQPEQQDQPRRFPDSPPPQASDHSFTLQTVMELQRSMGKVEQAVVQLTKVVETQGKTLNVIQYTLVFTAGVVSALGYVGKILWDKLDTILAFIQSSL